MNVLGWVAVALAGATPSLAPPAAEPWVTWAQIELDGTPAGWTRWEERSHADGAVEVVQEMHMELLRGTDRVAMHFRSTSIETAGGAPRTVDVVEELGGPAQRERWTFDGDRVVVEVEGLGEGQAAPWPAGCLGPSAARRALEASIASGETSLTLCQVDPTVGPAGVEVRYELGEEAVAMTTEGSVTGRAARWTTSVMPDLVTQTVLDARGVPLLSASQALGLEMVVRATNAGVVERPMGQVETMVSTLIRPSRPILRPRTTERLRLRLSVGEGRVPDLPTTSAQRWRRDGDAVVVDLSAAPGKPVTGGQASPGSLGRSSLIDPADPELVALAERLAPTGAPAVMAEALRAGVHRHLVHKGLGLGLASASEAARQQAGDCTEHAVLLAALLRARGIPARVATGVVYVEAFVGQTGVFGYHMWTQAWLDEGAGARWVDLDAALDPSRPFDATHVALAVTDLSDAAGTQDLWSLATLPGRLQIDVLRASRGR